MLRWFVVAVPLFVVLLLLPFGPFEERVWRSVAYAAAYATLWPLPMAFAKRVQAPRPGQVCAAGWRVRRGRRRGLFREGRLMEAPDGLAAQPFVGSGGPVLRPAEVESLTERPLTRGERFWMGGRRRVLDLTVAGRRIDVAVDADDVPVVRRLLGRPDQRSAGGESRSE